MSCLVADDLSITHSNLCFILFRSEFLEINEAAKIEARIAREEIQAESVVERENESVSLEHIKLVGKARMEEAIHVIETFFWHIAGSLQHIITPEGRQQFLFYVCSIGVLVFAVSTIKEMLALMCCCILRFLTAPRLVREYGNLRTQIRWFSETKARKEIVLPRKIRDRMDTIIKVASAASVKRYPLRSVLIHGKPGCGKSMAALELAQSIPNLPYALMSGADVFPMGKCTCKPMTFCQRFTNFSVSLISSCLRVTRASRASETPHVG